MKKTIAVVLALIMVLSLAAIPVSAAPRAILDGYCTLCGRQARSFYNDVVKPGYDHFYVQSCFEYLEPHYHSIFGRSHYLMCINYSCDGNGAAVLVDGPYTTMYATTANDLKGVSICCVDRKPLSYYTMFKV